MWYQCIVYQPSFATWRETILCHQGSGVWGFWVLVILFCFGNLITSLCNHEGRCHQLIEMPEQKAGNTGVIGDISKLALEPLCTQISCGIINMLIVYVAVNLTFHYLQQKKKI